MGVVGLALWLTIARATGSLGLLSLISALFACAVPMVVWSVLVERVHTRPTTGIDWTQNKPCREISFIKILSLWGVWIGGAAILWASSLAVRDNAFVQACLFIGAPVLLLGSLAYVPWLDRKLVEPRDGCYSFGLLLVGRFGEADRPAMIDYLRGWAIKFFFLTFMFSIWPRTAGIVVNTSPSADPVSLATWLIALMFMFDVAFGTVGYILACRPLDSHMRSTNPFWSGWVAALICYPPILLMGRGGSFDYHQGTASWTTWFDGQPLVLWTWGAMLVGLTAVYAWATIAFGIRFSNLTHRGIITTGPYAFTKHPAYISKNLFWWLSIMPLLTIAGDVQQGVRNGLLLFAVNLVYFWRAKTEEAHLMSDPAYQRYSSKFAGRRSHQTPALDIAPEQ